MTPAGTNVEQSNGVVQLFENLISRPSHNRPQTPYKQPADKQERHTAEYHILLTYELPICTRLWFVQQTLDQSPRERVEDGLDVDDPARPAVKELKVLVRNTGEE